MWLLLTACAPAPPAPVAVVAPRPPGLVADAAEVRVDRESVRIHRGGVELGVVPRSAFGLDPVDTVQADVRDLLVGAPDVWLPLADDTPWFLARTLIGSARAAGHPTPWLGDTRGPALRAAEPAPIALKVRCAEPVVWTGVQPRVTIALQRDAEVTWMRATARFLPLVDGVATDGLPTACLAPQACAAVVPTDLVPTCAARAEAPTRVELGGPVGCMLPLLTDDRDPSPWDRELPGVLTALRLDAAAPVVIAPEAAIPWRLVLATLRGFDTAQLPIPALSLPLVEGNDGPPICDADVRDRGALDAAGARVAGAWIPPEP